MGFFYNARLVNNGGVGEKPQGGSSTIKDIVLILGVHIIYS